jgi:hypothetical protein
MNPKANNTSKNQKTSMDEDLKVSKGQKQDQGRKLKLKASISLVESPIFVTG